MTPLFLGLIILSLGSSDLGAASIVLDSNKLVDLTHPFDETTVYWPTSPSRFELKSIQKGKTDKGYFYSANRFCTPEHGGTHVDAPLHFSAQGRSVDQIPLKQMIGNAVVIDIQSKVESNTDYRLTIEDIQSWENHFGKIPVDSIVLLRTGWSKYWPDQRKYLGDRKDVSKLHFPSFGEESVRFLIEKRKIKALGVDTPSIDYGQSNNFLVHRLTAENNIPGIENLTQLEQLPEKGFSIIALPMKISSGSGAPLRVIAVMG